MTRYLYGGTLMVFAAVAVALGAVIYKGGMVIISNLQYLIPNTQYPITLYYLLPLAIIALAGAVGLWYLLRSLTLNLRGREVAIERTRTEFTPTERGFAPRLIEGKVVNLNVVPSAGHPAGRCGTAGGEVPEERRLAGVVGWHLSNAPPGRPVRLAQQTALPIPEPQPAPWEISHVEKLLLEAGDEIERGDREGRLS